MIWLRKKSVMQLWPRQRRRSRGDNSERAQKYWRSDREPFVVVNLFILSQTSFISNLLKPRTKQVDCKPLRLQSDFIIQRVRSYNFIVMQASSIQLTAKKTHYGVDGTGRDTYINFDNGGNFRGYFQQGLGKFERGEFPTAGRGRINSSYVPIEGRPLHYIGDGTGRDTYIISNEGGVAKGIGKKHNFLENLRAPIPRREFKETDIYSRTQVGWRGKLPPAFGNEQRRLDRRLSQHRKYEDPYVAMRSTFRDSLRKGL